MGHGNTMGTSNGNICCGSILRYCFYILQFSMYSSMDCSQISSQLVCRSYHSTETAVLKVLSDILLALDSGKLALLSLLDLSAAFDSVDHVTLLQRLQTSYGLGGNVIAWFASYLTGHRQYVRTAASRSVSLATSQ